ncbi:hypothetical protein [Curtobacterium sp. MCPF17_052]|uniref:hypothetical protein n=1 Tax=Curtobacterium sp. MCPF17_052 TaxID=2175655 RepID=UPI0024DF321F|nr:hypothetical protein [Curtobacterium sp. MCPF17_052]WIB12590.1 hypothetical protein DEJ36_18625 [Curtobacterium sp. MCPF17_052]
MKDPMVVDAAVTATPTVITASPTAISAARGTFAKIVAITGETIATTIPYTVMV